MVKIYQRLACSAAVLMIARGLPITQGLNVDLLHATGYNYELLWVCHMPHPQEVACPLIVNITVFNVVNLL